MSENSVIPEPTEADLARDAAADLAVCEAATEGPWVVMAEGLWQGDPLEKPRSIAHPRPDLAERFPAKDGYGPVFHEEHICLAWGVKRENLALIALARTALPAWIRRAEKAETLATALGVATADLVALVEKLETSLLHALWLLAWYRQSADEGYRQSKNMDSILDYTGTVTFAMVEHADKYLPQGLKELQSILSKKA